jgi:Lipoprotein LpqB beta-propeller domain
VNRRRFLGLTAALGATAAAGAACGVPSTSDPQRVGNAPSSGPTPAAPPEPPRADDATSPIELVQNYLKVTAWANVNGDKSEELAQAQTRARAFLAAPIAEGWKPGSTLTVGRARFDSSQTDQQGRTSVTVVWTSLGKLNEFGAIEPDQLPSATLVFVVATNGVGYRIVELPKPDLLLSDEGLRAFYDQQPIYFWDQNDPNNALLVPDVRYLPRSIAEPKRPAEIVRWVKRGPAAWLLPVVQGWPTDVDLKEEPSLDGNNRLVVNLNSKAATLDKTALRALAIQLRWSVNPSQRVALRIEGTATDSPTEDYASFNLALRNDDTDEPERFCTVKGKVRGIGSANGTPILDSPENVDVVSAAMPLSKDAIALVRNEGKNNPKKRLWVGGRSGPTDRNAPVYVRTNVMGTTISRPTWLRRPSLQALVACDGHLYAVAPPSAGKAANVSAVRLDPLPPGVPGPVTAVSVSPDGHRLALIAGGFVVVVPLVAGPQLDFGPGFLLVKHEIPSPQAVGWSNDTRLVIGGSPGAQVGTGLAEVGIDGVGHAWVPSTGQGRNLVVTMVSVHPSSAIRRPSSSLVMFESNGAAWNVYASDVGPLPLDVPSPSPSGGQPSPPSAPFFLD